MKIWFPGSYFCLGIIDCSSPTRIISFGNSLRITSAIDEIIITGTILNQRTGGILINIYQNEVWLVFGNQVHTPFYRIIQFQSGFRFSRKALIPSLVSL